MSADEMDAFKGYLAEQMNDREVRAGFEDHGQHQRLIDTLVQTRKDLGLTQTEVARRMGVSQATVSGFETEMSDPRLSSLLRYARAVDRELRITVTVRPPDEG